MTTPPFPNKFHMPDEYIAPSADRLRRRARTALILVAVLFLGFLGLAAALQIGGAVIGNGEVTVASGVKEIAHPSGGILTAILVKEGDAVVSGQELMRFDTAVSGVTSRSASTSLVQLLARRTRLEAERNGASTIFFPPELTTSDVPETRQIIAGETQLFRLHLAQRHSVTESLIERIRQHEEQIAALRAEIVAIDEQMQLIEPELDGLRKLYERRLVTINRLNQMERTAVQMRGSKAALQSNIAEVRARISQTNEEITTLATKQRSEAASDLATVLAQLNEQGVRLASATDTYRRDVIRAPQSGVVDKIAFTTIGSAVPPNQPILSLVPDSGGLIVEARVRPQDVDQLHVGQHARITFSGLNRQTTPDIAGRLIFVSPDLAHDERATLSFYRIRIKLDAKAVTAASITLQPGMPAEVFIQTGDRSILSFLFKPLLDQIRYALRDQ